MNQEEGVVDERKKGMKGSRQQGYLLIDRQSLCGGHQAVHRKSMQKEGCQIMRGNRLFPSCVVLSMLWVLPTPIL